MSQSSGDADDHVLLQIELCYLVVRLQEIDRVNLRNLPQNFIMVQVDFIDVSTGG